MKTKQVIIKKRIQNKGFTLVELLVSISIFSLILSAMSGAFVSTIRAQRKSIAFQQLLEQTSYLEEYMSRSIRMAKKELNCTSKLEPTTCACLKTQGYGANYELTHEEKGIKFLNYNRDCQEFYVSNSQLWENKNGVDLALTSSNLMVENINIELSGNSQTDNLQPRVTIFLKIKGAGSKSEEQPEIKIQITISQRNPDVRY